jgi:hypothetical protein
MTTEATLTLLEGFRAEWANGVGGLDLLTQDPVRLERITTGLAPLAQSLIELFDNMVEQRRLVREQHPYWFGALLNFLIEPGVQVGEDAYSRFEIMQRAGFFHGRKFVEWANEHTGVKEKTWRQWMQVIRVYFNTDAGKKVLEDQGLEPDDLVEAVPIGKAIRAMSKVSTGAIKSHQVEALVDPVKTEAQLNHILRTTPEQHEQEEAEREKAEKQWVESTEPRHWIDWDPTTRRLVLKQVDEDGVYGEALVARVPDPSNAAVGLIQDAMIQAAQDWVNENGVVSEGEPVKGELEKLFVGDKEEVK